jgi:hypothetical protein
MERTRGRTTLGVDLGLLRYKSWWQVQGYWPAPGTCPACSGEASLDEWDNARGWHTTWYLGMTLEYRGLFLQARRYAQIYASQAEADPLRVGAIGGPLPQVTVGYQWRFR